MPLPRLQLNTLELQSRLALLRLRTLLSETKEKKCVLVMGVLNVTPDSFSDGGHFNTLENALTHAEQMIAEGADILDIGGESTRPATFDNTEILSVEEECARVLPVIRALSQRFPNTPLSIDTYKAEVAEQALAYGVVMLNDISAFRADPNMLKVVVRAQVPTCIMHLLGLPKAIPLQPHYDDVVNEVKAHLRTQADLALKAGLAQENLIIDPGFGFGKTVAHNLTLLRRLHEFTELGYPILMGTSRKSTIGKVLGDLPPQERLEGTAATVALSIANGASLVRVHDVKEMVRVAQMTHAVLYGWQEKTG